MIFKNIKNILKDIYLDMKKDTRYIIQFNFKISDEEIFTI